MTAQRHVQSDMNDCPTDLDRYIYVHIYKFPFQLGNGIMLTIVFGNKWNSYEFERKRIYDCLLLSLIARYPGENHAEFILYKQISLLE